jgi:hypothetical protein
MSEAPAPCCRTGNNMLPSGGLPSPNPRGVLATLLAVANSSVLGAAANGTVQTAATFYGEVLDTIFTPAQLQRGAQRVDERCA